MLAPLAVVITVSAIKDIFEDYKRHKSDNEENYKKVKVFDYQSKDFKVTTWREIKVGQVV